MFSRFFLGAVNLFASAGICLQDADKGFNCKSAMYECTVLKSKNDSRIHFSLLRENDKYSLGIWSSLIDRYILIQFLSKAPLKQKEGWFNLKGTLKKKKEGGKLIDFMDILNSNNEEKTSGEFDGKKKYWGSSPMFRDVFGYIEYLLLDSLYLKFDGKHALTFKIL